MMLPKWAICSIRPYPLSVTLFSLPRVTPSPQMPSYKSALSLRLKPLRQLPNSARAHVAQTSSITCLLFPKPFQVNFIIWKFLKYSLLALSWILITPTPGPHVKEMKDAAMFYTNRVLKEYKGKNDDHVNWTKMLLGMLNELIQYIKAHHTTGLTWNVKV